MRLIDADELKEEIALMWGDKNHITESVHEIIDNAPTVEYPFYQEAYQTGYEEGKNERPQGEWISHIQYCKQHNLIPTGYELFVWCNRCNCPNEKKTKFCPNCGAKMKGGAV